MVRQELRPAVNCAGWIGLVWRGQSLIFWKWREAYLTKRAVEGEDPVFFSMCGLTIPAPSEGRACWLRRISQAKQHLMPWKSDTGLTINYVYIREPLKRDWDQGNVLLFAWKQLYSDALFVDSGGNKSIDSFLWAVKRKMFYPRDIFGGENTHGVWKKNRSLDCRIQQVLASKWKEGERDRRLFIYFPAQFYLYSFLRFVFTWNYYKRKYSQSYE